jgi:hypothetical protein
LTAHYGKISIQGGAVSGNGGLAEVSGANLDYRGLTNGLAPKGISGTLLLDPTDVTITNQPSDLPLSCGTFVPSATSPFNINNNDLSVQLATCSVSIATSTSTGGGTGSISLTSAVSWTSSSALTLDASSFIQISDNIDGGSLGSISLIAAGVGTSQSAIDIGISGPARLSANSITLNGTSSSSGYGVLLRSNAPLAGGSGGISITGTSTSATGSPAINCSSSITTTAGSGGTISLSGTGGAGPGISILLSGGSLSSAGALSLTSTDSGLIANGTAASSLVAIGAPVTITGQVSLTQPLSINTVSGGPGGANISFVGANSSINGAVAVSLTAGTSGIVSFAGNIGDTTTSLTSFTVNSSNGIQPASSVSSIYSDTVSLTGPLTLANDLLISTALGSMGTAGGNISFVGETSTVDGAHALTLDVGSTGVLGLGGVIGGATQLTTFTARYDQPFFLSKNITTSTSIAFNGKTLSTPGLITLTSSNVVFTSGQITLQGPVAAQFNGIDFSLEGTAGTIVLNGSIGSLTTRFATVSLTGDVTTNSAANIFADQIIQTAGGSGTSSYNGALDASANVSLTAANISIYNDITGSSGVSLNGSTIFINGDPTVSTAGGTISIVNSSSLFLGPSTLSAGFGITQSGGGSIFLTGTNAETATISSVAGNITIAGIIDGNSGLSIGAGGSVFFNGAIGGTSPFSLDHLIVTGRSSIGHAITTQGTAGAVFQGPTTLVGDVTVTTGNRFTGGPITFNSIDGNYNLNLVAGTGAISFDGPLGGSFPLKTLVATGSTISQASGLTYNNTLSGSGVNYTGAIRLGGSITGAAGSGPIAFNGPVTFIGNLSIDTSAANSSITFASTIDSDSNAPRPLQLRAGTGSVILAGAIGNTIPLRSLDIIGGAITQSSTVRYNGVISGSTGLSYQGSAINLNGASITGVTVNAGSLIMTGPVLMGSDLIFDLSASSLVANIQFTSTIDGARALSLVSSNTGTITLTGAVGANTAIASIAASPYKIVQSSSLTYSGTGGVGYTGSNQIQLSSITSVASGTGAITMTGPVSLAALTNINSSSSNAPVTFTSTIGGVQELYINAGTGSVNLSGAGNPISVKSLVLTGGSITQNAGLSFTDTSTLGGFSGYGAYYNGPTTLGNDINISGATANSGQIVFTSPVILGTGLTNISTTTSSSPILFSSTITSGVGSSLLVQVSQTVSTGTITLSGQVGTSIAPIQTLGLFGYSIIQGSDVYVQGTSPQSVVNYQSNLTTGSITLNGTTTVAANGGNLSYSGPVILGSNVLLDTHLGSTAGSDIRFQTPGTIGGTSLTALTLNAGNGGIINIGGSLGCTAPIGDFTINSSASYQLNGICSVGAISITSQGQGVFNGNYAIDTASTQKPFSVTGPAFLLAGNFTSVFTNGGNPTSTPSISFNATGGAAAGALTGINLTGSITTVDGSILLIGTGGNSSNSTGISVEGTGRIIATGGANVTLTGTGSAVSPADFSTFGHGVSFSSTTPGAMGNGNGTLTITGTGSANIGNGISLGSTAFVATSTTPYAIAGIASGGSITNFSSCGINAGGTNPLQTKGPITISGDASAATGQFSHGFVNTSSWSTTANQVTFTNCKGGTGTNSNGINLQVGSSFITAGPLTAVTSIIGGAGDSTFGLFSQGTLSAAGNLYVTGSTSSNTGAAGTSSGISVSGGSITTSSGDVRLIGIGSAFASSNGLSMSGNVNLTNSGSGLISLAGKALGNSAGTSGSGVSIAGGPLSIQSSGQVNISGTSASSVLGSAGVTITASVDSTTTQSLVFGNSISDGTNTISGCLGGSGSTSHGLVFSGAAIITTAGSITTGVGGIVGGTGPSSSGLVSFNSTVTCGGDINLVASVNTSNTITGSVTGINISGGTFKTTALATGNTATVTLTGTGSLSGNVSNSFGVSLQGQVQSTSAGNVIINGTAPAYTSATITAPGVGVNLNLTGPTFGAFGTLTINGVSLAQGNFSYGLSVNGYASGTTGTVFLNGSGGSGQSSHGVNITGNFSARGPIKTGTTGIFGGSGIFSYGLNTSTATISSVGDTNLTASSAAVSGNGINIFNTNIATAAGTSANIVLSGTSSSPSAASFGVSLSGTTTTLNVPNGFSKTINGISSGGGTGVGVRLSSTSASSGALGPFTISGISSSTGGGSHGVSITGTCNLGTTNLITFTNCHGGTGNNSNGIDVSGAFTTPGSVAVGSATDDSVYGSAGGQGNSGFRISGATSTFSSTNNGSIQIYARTLDNAAEGTSAFGVNIAAGTINTANGAITIQGTASPASISGNPGGVQFPQASTGLVSTTTGSISITGIVPTGPAIQASGIFIGTYSGGSTTHISSTSGQITLSGTSASSGLNSHGLRIQGNLPLATTGDVTFINCTGGSGATSHGAFINGAFSTGGGFRALTNIAGGSGSGSSGFVVTATGSFSAGNFVNITASTLAGTSTTATPSGISIASGLFRTTLGQINLNGFGSVQSGVANTTGISISGTTNFAGPDSTNINGTVNATTATGVGILLSTTYSGADANNGAMSIVGVSRASGASSYGTSITSWRTGTSGQVAVSGSSTGSDGINVSGAFSSGGLTIFSGLTTSSTGTSNGINIVGASLTTPGQLVVFGTGSTTGATTNGISYSGTWGLSGAIIQVGGVTPLGSTGTGVGVLLNGTGTIASTDFIALSGVSSAAGANSYGVSVMGPVTVTGGQPFNFGTQVTDGIRGFVIESCTGGLGPNSDGLNFGAPFSVPNSLTATTIFGGTGPGSNGLTIQNAISAGGVITLTANSSVTNGPSSALLITTGGSLTTTNGSTIVLRGFAAAANAGVTNYGTYLQGGTITNAGLVDIRGYNHNSDAQRGIGLYYAGASSILPGTIVTSTGPNRTIHLRGESYCTGTNSYGLWIASPWTSGPEPIAIDTCIGGDGTGGDAIYIGAPFTCGGTFDAIENIIGGSGSNGFTCVSDFTAGGDINLTAQTNGTTGTPVGISLSNGTFQTTSGNITLIGFGSPSVTTTPTIGLDVASTSIISAPGLIQLAGQAPTVPSQGVGVHLASSAITSGTANGINITGSSSAAGSNSYGVWIDGPWTSANAAPITVGLQIIDAEMSSVDNCSGGSGTNSYGFYASAPFNSTGGDLTITASTLSATAPSVLFESTLTTVGGDIAITGATNVQMNGAVSSSALNGGVIALSSTGGSILTGNISSRGTAGTGGNIALQPGAALNQTSLGKLPAGTLRFNEAVNVTVDARGTMGSGNISLAPTGRSSGPSVATIYSTYPAGNVSFFGNDFSMGAYEAMTVYGDATLTLTGVATVGDIIALDTLMIDATSITLNQRPTIELLAYNGTSYLSAKPHLLSGVEPVFSLNVMPAGSETGLLGTTESSLIYLAGNLPLNYDRDQLPVPPPPVPVVPSSMNEEIIYLFTVANAQLFDLLPMIPKYWEWKYIPYICFKRDKKCQVNPHFEFKPFLLENRLVY